MFLALLVLGTSNPKIRAPRIAHLAGVIVGATTVEQFERHFGKGKVLVAGHSNGGRSWFDKRTRTTISGEGFYYAGVEEVLDGINVSWNKAKWGHNVPAIRLRKKDLGNLAGLREGMSKRKVESLLRIKLNSEDEVIQRGLIQFNKPLGNKNDGRYTVWKATFSFEPGLEGITVSAE